MKTFVALLLPVFLISCGSVDNNIYEDREDIELPSQDTGNVDSENTSNEVSNDRGDDTDWNMEDIEAGWDEQRQRSEGFDFIGLSEEEASELARESNIPFRVVMRDGEMLPVTMDYVPGRINAQVEDGIVTSFSIE